MRTSEPAFRQLALIPGCADGESFRRDGKNPRVEMGVAMRRHHEEIAVLPALSLLLPFAGALWLRIKAVRRPDRDAQEQHVRKCEGDL
jgi:hypothetical protein